MKQITAYTDGACKGNPGPGGIGIILDWNGNVKEFSYGFLHTTNNEMELLAVITALYKLTEKCDILIHTDSQYVVNAFNKDWIKKWKNNGWMTTKKEPVKNKELWLTILTLMQKHKVQFKHVFGHTGIILNEKADELANRGCKFPRKYDVAPFIKELKETCKL